MGTIVKLKMMLCRLVPRTRRKINNELISSEYSFNQVVKNEVGIDLFTDKTSSKPIDIDISDD